MREVDKFMYKLLQFIFITFHYAIPFNIFWNSNKFLNGKTYGIWICQVRDII